MPGSRIVTTVSKIVMNLLRYFENECSQNKLSVPLSQLIKRTALATDVSTGTVNRMKREVKNSGNVQSPSKRRRIGKLICSSTSLDEFDSCVIRETFSDFYGRIEIPLLRTLLQNC
ncbi:hypothetical protein HNY73_007341 [Argiope bruennichi]|uniref:Uncharacterized protein n=1 Tax=Argiope bruennichi TaxID=94029 RepID=A0A8T0FEL3_ARGBR|nr:hypothetical protein HNY73_007341 [Argiope bruennichi]